MAEVLGLILDTTSDIPGSSIYIRELHSGFFQLVQKEESGDTPLDTKSSLYRPLRCSDLYKILQRRNFNQTGIAVLKPANDSLVFFPGYRITPYGGYVWIEVRDIYEYNYYQNLSYGTEMTEYNVEDPDNLPTIPEEQYEDVQKGLIFGRWTNTDPETGETVIKYKYQEVTPVAGQESNYVDVTDIWPIPAEEGSSNWIKYNDLGHWVYLELVSYADERYWITRGLQKYEVGDRTTPEAWTTQTPDTTNVEFRKGECIELDPDYYDSQITPKTMESFEADYQDIFGNMDSIDKVNLHNTSEAHLSKLNTKTRQFCDTLIDENQPVYTNEVNLTSYLLDLEAQHTYLVRVEVSVQYVLENDPYKIHTYNTFFSANIYSGSSLRTILGDGDVELELCGGLLRAFPIKDTVTECIISNCSVTYGSNEETSE